MAPFEHLLPPAPPRPDGPTPPGSDEPTPPRPDEHSPLCPDEPTPPCPEEYTPTRPGRQSAGTWSRAASSRATPPHLKRPAAVHRKTSGIGPARAMHLTTHPPRPAVASARHQGAALPLPVQPMARSARPGSMSTNALALRIGLQKVPKSWNTWDIYNFFAVYGHVARVDIRQVRTQDLHVVLLFRPAPTDISWVGRPLRVSDPDGRQRAIETNHMANSIQMYRSPNNPNTLMPEQMVVALSGLHFGMMKSDSEYLGLHAVDFTQNMGADISIDLQYKEINLSFPVRARRFRFHFTPAQVSHAYHLTQENGTHSLILGLDNPPLAFRKSNNVRATHNDEATLWDERQTWFRQTDIDLDPTARDRPIELRKTDSLVDFGRWTTYRLDFSQETVASAEYRNFCQALADHNIVLVRNKNVSFTYGSTDAIWSWAEHTLPSAQDLGHSVTSALQDLTEASCYLPFPLRYQLDVCLSSGALLECNIDVPFLQRLAAMDTARAIKVLERVADHKTREYNPMNIFRLQNQAQKKKRPEYCTRIPSVIVTPSTVYMATPVLETSNRVVRHFKTHEDRFLRVKFTDERFKGKILSSDDNRMNEVFSRIKRAMTYGIQIGDRRYEILAFGNSQFREHGAYFFASTPDLTAGMIRDWLGRFSHIRVIAKYVSRLGQCFSTTRAIPIAVSLDRIPDIERNGYCFTDGAGKMSIFLARMIANHYHMPNSEQNFPSAVQFRFAGCKGVLAVDSALKGLTVQIRPSQEKFPAEFRGLEVCRISQFSTANLNTQIILVLSALGIDDEVFLGKTRAILGDIKEAMSDERKALELLQKNIDYSQTTILLATMVYDGFMKSQDPFTLTCLRLWRSWCLKYLKEKARIYIEQGFFGLAVPDETGILRGHCIGRQDLNRNDDAHTTDYAQRADLPEIFLQVPDPDAAGKYRVVEGVCILARNPSLHPGDVRTALAVDKPELRHLRDVVVVPTTGDRDLANMCSGGDLDGDDFMVIWDQDLIPRGVDHPPMDYTSPDPVTSDGPVSVDDMTSFFVKHIKNDNLASIAVAHRYWADQLADGVKDPKCIELAQLHSKAVDYPKTGVPAIVNPGLKVKMWPHWSEPKNKATRKIYRSNRVLGKLYDEVQREPFYGAWDMPFDQRILKAGKPSEEMLQDARDIKVEYDGAMRRIMAQHGIKTEFEVWTTFVLEHHPEIGDYKFAETMSTITTSLLEEHREMCYQKVGVNKAATVTPSYDELDDMDKLRARMDEKAERDQNLELFIVAMYKVTADEVAAACQDTTQMVQKGNREVPLRSLEFSSMPFMSFPWIFARELGQIATKGKTKTSLSAMPRPTMPTKTTAAEKQYIGLVGDDIELSPLQEITLTNVGVVKEGDILGLFPGHAGAGSDGLAKAGELLINVDPLSQALEVLASSPQVVEPESGPEPAPASSNAFAYDEATRNTLQTTIAISHAAETLNVPTMDVPTMGEEVNTGEGHVGEAEGHVGEAEGHVGEAEEVGVGFEPNDSAAEIKIEVMPTTLDEKFSALFG